MHVHQPKQRSRLSYHGNAGLIHNLTFSSGHPATGWIQHSSGMLLVGTLDWSDIILLDRALIESRCFVRRRVSWHRLHDHKSTSSTGFSPFLMSCCLRDQSSPEISVGSLNLLMILWFVSGEIPQISCASRNKTIFSSVEPRPIIAYAPLEDSPSSYLIMKPSPVTREPV